MFKNFFTIALRNLIKNRTFTILNVSGLAIGIVVCLVIGVWLQRELSFDDFHPNGDKIFRLANTFKSESESFSQAPSGPAFGAQLPKLLPNIKSACRLFRSSAKVTSGNQQFFEDHMMYADTNFFQFFGFGLIRGQRTEVLNNLNKIVLTQKMAVKYFGNAPAAIGKTLVLDGQDPFIVSGVAENPPVNSQVQFDFLLPSSFLTKLVKERWKDDLDNQWVGGWPMTYVELADANKQAETEKQINQVAVKYSEKDWKENKMSYQYFLQPIKDIHLKSHLRYDAVNNGSISTVNIFSITGIIVLLLACINYVNLTTAGAVKRAKETAVRKVLGAVKLQLISQFFFETLIVCSISVVLGVTLFKLVLPLFSQWIGQPYNFPLNATNITILAAFALIISLIAGIYPAAILSSFNPATTLKGSLYQSAAGVWIRRALVVFQFTITIALVASILIISQQLNFIKNKSLGFEGKAVIEVAYNGDASVQKQYTAIRNDLLQNPYIKNVSMHDGNVVGDLGNGWTTTENLKGEEISTSLYQISVDSSYMDTYSMKLAAGRFFSKDVPTDTLKSVLVNEAAVKTFGWQKPENAIGKRFGKGNNAKFVIGVVKDFNFQPLHKPVEALLISYARTGSSISLKANTAHIDEVKAQLEKTWKALVPQVPLQFSFVDEEVVNQYGSEQKMQGIFFGFSAISLLIACLGLFGLSIFIMERKTKEIGIRKVLGANVAGIVSLLSTDFLKLVFTALVIASPIALYFMNNWLKDFAYRINISAWVFIASGFIALAIALVTVSVQAIKAAMANPVKSLRTE